MNFDKCDGGLPCMCPTTGCKKGQCARRLHPQAGLDWSLPARLRRVATTLGDAMHNEAADRIDELERALRAALVERGELALKLAGAECYIEEQKKKTAITADELIERCAQAGQVKGDWRGRECADAIRDLKGRFVLSATRSIENGFPLPQCIHRRGCDNPAKCASEQRCCGGDK